MEPRHWRVVAAAGVVVFLGVLVLATAPHNYGAALAAESKQSDEAGDTERAVTKSQVPPAALKALQKMAGKAEIKEFAEETEDGATFYEGSWESKRGRSIDVLVTRTGDVVEIEEQINANKLPAMVKKAARKAAGEGTELSCEKKTSILYEIKFTNADGEHEMLFTPDGRAGEEDVEKADAHDEDVEKANGREEEEDKQ